jgi:hypothetical protein
MGATLAGRMRCGAQPAGGAVAPCAMGLAIVAGELAGALVPPEPAADVAPGPEVVVVAPDVPVPVAVVVSLPAAVVEPVPVVAGPPVVAVPVAAVVVLAPVVAPVVPSPAVVASSLGAWSAPVVASSLGTSAPTEETGSSPAARTCATCGATAAPWEAFTLAGTLM